MPNPRAHEAAERARRALARGDARDAAWLGLWSTELDPESGLGLAVVARVLHAVSGDHLATLGVHRALELEMPAAARAEVGRFHRIDLWSRGLLAHHEGQAILPASAFDEPERFAATAAHDPWFEERIARWGSVEGAVRALRRLVGALSDALEVPTESADPLRAELPWPDMPAFASWKAEDPLRSPDPEAADTWPEEASGGADPDDEEPTDDGDPAVVVSDAWTAVQVEALEARGRLGEALEVAERWAALRPGRVSPRIVLLRLLTATGRTERIPAVEREILGLGTEDLNELEEARVGLGLLGRFEAQLEILDRMDRLAPGHPVILANRGAARLELDQPEAAEADLQLALQLDPSSGPALTNLALLRLREGAPAVARGLLEQAKLLYPDEPVVRCYLAACLEQQGQLEAARREVEAALDADPDHEPAHALLARLRTERR